MDVTLPEAGNETDVGLSVTLGPDGDIVSVKVRIPENPLTLVSVMVELEEEPWVTFREAGLDAMLKSWPAGAFTWTVTVVVCKVDPLVPLTLTLNVPDGVEDVVETVSVEVADVPEERVTLMELNDGVGPEGETPVAKLTVPLKPLRLVNVMVEVPDAPCRNVREEGFDVIEKSGVGGGAWTPKAPIML